MSDNTLASCLVSSGQVGNFMSSSLTPLHFEDKLVFIGDSAHTMYAPSQTSAVTAVGHAFRCLEINSCRGLLLSANVL